MQSLRMKLWYFKLLIFDICKWQSQNHNVFIWKITILSEIQLSQSDFCVEYARKFTVNAVKSNCKPKVHVVTLHHSTKYYHHDPGGFYGTLAPGSQR